MRQIDVDVLLNEIKKDTEVVIKQDDKAGSFWLGYLAGLVIKQPIIQSKPKEGYWIDNGWSGDWVWQTDGRGNCWRVIVCSECGKSVSVESSFCPHCGAKMMRKIND